MIIGGKKIMNIQMVETSVRNKNHGRWDNMFNRHKDQVKLDYIL